MTAPMTIVLNGEPADLAPDATVADVVTSLGHDPSLPGVAVAIDGVVVRRVDWPRTPLADGAVVEVLTAVQGGC
nr:sulfur carrier protein ThiS [Euzebya rosea]